MKKFFNNFSLTHVFFPLVVLFVICMGYGIHSAQQGATSGNVLLKERGIIIRIEYSQASTSFVLMGGRFPIMTPVDKPESWSLCIHADGKEGSITVNERSKAMSLNAGDSVTVFLTKSDLPDQLTIDSIEK